MRLTVPVPTIRCTQKEVLDDDHHPVPKHYLAPEDRCVERRDLAWGLTVVVWQAEVDDKANCPKEECDGRTYRSVFRLAETLSDRYKLDRRTSFSMC